LASLGEAQRDGLVVARLRQCRLQGVPTNFLPGPGHALFGLLQAGGRPLRQTGQPVGQALALLLDVEDVAVGLALWSFGMIIARSCSLTAVADLPAPLLGQSFNTMRERLRDTYREAGAKAGDRRAELDVALCRAPWLAWILDGWEGEQLAIAADATNLGCRFVALVISVVYRGCAVPVAWKILKAGLAPECADACWYGLRAWIEQGFKRSKRGGWQWQHTRMDDPARAERLWMAMAIATWWLLSVGGEAEAQADTPLDIKTPSVPGAVRRRGKRWRLVFDRRGLA